LEDRPEPVAGPGEALLRPLAVGTCGTDLHPERFAFDPGVIMGHELSAEVVGLGRGTSRLAVGDRVVVNPNGITCGACTACRAGRPNLCQPAHRASIGIHRDGGLAELVAVPERALHRIPDTLGDEPAAWAEPLAAAIHAVRAAGPVAGLRALVLGAGPIGLLTLQLLRNGGAAFIRLVEPVRSGAGSRSVWAPTRPDSVASAGRRAAPGLVVECSGSPAALSAAVHLVADGGSITVIGIGPVGPGIVPLELVGKEVTVRGSAVRRRVPDGHRAAGGPQDRCRCPDDRGRPSRRFAAAFEAMRNPEGAVKYLLRP
jgi:threonine dehydrogenase-like Zn-dependent dehydrogenase